MRVLLFSLLWILSSSSAIAAESRNRLEELFIWKVSEELKLSIPEEKSFTELTKKLSVQRTKINDDIQASLKKLSEAKSKSEHEKQQAAYRTQVKKYHDLNLQEFDQMKKLLGTEKLSKYLVLKNDLTAKVKTLLATPPSEKEDKKLQEPKIIE